MLKFAGSKDVCRNPAFKSFGIRELARNDETVNTRFIDNGHLLCSSKGVAIRDALIFCVHVLTKCVSWITIPEHKGVKPGLVNNCSIPLSP